VYATDAEPKCTIQDIQNVSLLCFQFTMYWKNTDL